MTASRSRQSGVGMVEVMVAVLVLAIGVLGVAALQAITLKNSSSSASRSQAAIQIYSMMDIIRADRINIGSYNTNIYVAGDGSGEPGSKDGWLDGLKGTVAPDAQGKIV
ncbi:type IV pilus modification protein PilV, partial [Stenotrophomonas nitritireducens]